MDSFEELGVQKHRPMIELIPEDVSFLISTTDVKVIYTETGSTIEVDTLDFENYSTGQLYKNCQIQFKTVALVRCITLNFTEHLYEEYSVFTLEDLPPKEYWKKYGHHPYPGFYEVDNSILLSNYNTDFDPLNNLSLKHYLIIGNDSYVEIVARSYTYQFLVNSSV